VLINNVNETLNTAKINNTNYILCYSTINNTVYNVIIIIIIIIKSFIQTIFAKYHLCSSSLLTVHLINFKIKYAH